MSQQATDSASMDVFHSADDGTTAAKPEKQGRQVTPNGVDEEKVPKETAMRNDQKDDEATEAEKEQVNKNEPEEKKQHLETVKDEKGYILHKVGDVIPSANAEYVIVDEKALGQGTYGRVLKVFSRKDSKVYALKVIRGSPVYSQVAAEEIRVFEHLKKHDMEGTKGVIQLLDHFTFGDHTCLLFHLYGLALSDFMKENKYRPFPVDQVRYIGFQLCSAVQFLHDNNIIHTDLKPANMLFVNSDFNVDKHGKRTIRDATILVIDVGTAFFADKHHPKLVTTANYRAPEVLMELGWSFPLDMWSVGCILYELLEGYPLFVFRYEHSRSVHLAMMEKILDPFPESMVMECEAADFFEGKVEWDRTYKNEETVRSCRFELTGEITPTKSLLKDLIVKMITFNPADRITAKDALDCPLFDSLRGPLQ